MARPVSQCMTRAEIDRGSLELPYRAPRHRVEVDADARVVGADTWRQRSRNGAATARFFVGLGAARTSGGPAPSARLRFRSVASDFLSRKRAQGATTLPPLPRQMPCVSLTARHLYATAGPPLERQGEFGVRDHDGCPPNTNRYPAPSASHRRQLSRWRSAGLQITVLGVSSGRRRK